MITYIFLFIVTIAIAIISYLILDKDFFKPTVISATMFSVSILCACIGRFSWNRVDNINICTFLIIIVGLISFLCGEVIAKKIQNHKSIKLSNNNFVYKYEENNNISFKVIVICVMFIVITTILMISEIVRICNFYGFSSNSFSKLLGFYRTKTELFSTSLANDGVGVNFVVKQMKKICDVLNIFLVFILFRTIANKEVKTKKLQCLVLIFGIIVGLIQTVLNSGGRSIMMHFIISYIVLGILFFSREKKNKKTSIKFLLSIPIIGIVILLLFYLILPLLGRTTDSNFIDYISFYLGSPIPSLTTFVGKIDGFNSTEFGSETFRGIYYVLDRIGIISHRKPLTHEWVSFVPGFASNVYTSLRSYYMDFSYIGVIVLQLFFGFCYGTFYSYTKESKRNLMIIIYSFYFYILIDQIRDEQFFSSVNTANLAYILLFIIIYRVLICNSIKKEMSGIFEKIKKKNNR